MMKMLKITPLFLLVMFMMGCSFNFEFTPYKVEYKLPIESAQEMTEDFMLAIAEDVENGDQYLFDTLVGEYESLQGILDLVNYHDPENIVVIEMQHGEGEFYTGEEYSRSIAVGTFNCEGSDHLSDFDIMWMYNRNDERWEVININFEEC